MWVSDSPICSGSEVSDEELYHWNPFPLIPICHKYREHVTHNDIFKSLRNPINEE